MKPSMNAISLKNKFESIKDHWHPHRVARVDGMQVLLAKVKGEFVWHSHEDEDELFQVIKGTLLMQFRDRTVTVTEGELIVVPKGVEHCPKTLNDEEVHLLLFEKDSIAHTGDKNTPLTREEYPDL